jgi:hypothetical protein
MKRIFIITISVIGNLISEEKFFGKDEICIVPFLASLCSKGGER